MLTFLPLLVLVLLAIVAVVIAGVVICNCKRQRPMQPKVLEETRPTVVAERPTPVQEPRPIVTVETEAVEESQPGKIQETPPPAVTETRPTMIKEVQSTFTEKAQPTAGGKTQQITAEQVQSMVPEVTQSASGDKEPAPVERRGVLEAETAGPGRQPPGKPKIRAPKPEIVCWKRERQWLMAVEVSEELLENLTLEVLQNNLPLYQDELEKTRWHLREVRGGVSVRWKENDSTQEAKVELGLDGYLLFKLSGRSLDQGRFVKFPSTGSYLVIVPEDWERDETLSGPPPAMPEPVCLAGYQAHFFDLVKGGNEKIAFHLPGGESLVVESRAPRFELVGERLEDASETMGPLFGKGPPCIRALDAQAWGNVRTIVVSEKGGSRGKWRVEFSPNPNQMEQDLPSELAARKSGWYLLRFYDTNGDPIESLDFRFISSLKRIKLLELCPLPSEDGHKSVYVEFLHEPDFILQPAEDYRHIQIERECERTVLIICPDPAWDETRWLVSLKDGPQVEVTLLVERLWWAIGEEGVQPDQWMDKPVALSREDFAATSLKTLYLRFPKRRWMDGVLVGFEKHKARKFPVKVSERIVVIPLRDFGDAQELCTVGTVSLYLWVCSYQSVVAKVMIRASCRFCGFLAFQREDIISHIESQHSNEVDKLFPSLTWEEMRKRTPSLPYKIYKCLYCDFYVAFNDPRSPTSVVCDHVEKECTKVPCGQGRRQIAFKVIDDVDEIRENVIKNLLRIRKCSLCETRLQEATSRDMMQHLVEQHEERLYALR